MLEQETTNPTISEIELKLELKRSEQVLDASTLSCMLQSSRSAVDRGIGFAPSINISINFATNSDQLTPQGMLQAKELADMLIMDDFSEYDIHIVGHADSRGDAFYNQALSERRAMSVKRTLEQISTRLLGILYAKGKGETQLKDTRNTNDAHMINRRVEVQLVAKG